MTIKINADTSDGLKIVSDTSGTVDIQSNGTTKFSVGSTIDCQGNELVLDSDADSSIHASTDDQIDFKAGGSDTMHIKGAKVGIGTSTFDTYNNFKVSSSSNVETAISIENTGTNGQKWELIGGSNGGAFTGGRFGLYSRTNSNSIWQCVSTTSSGVIAGGGTHGRALGLVEPGIWFDRTWENYPGITVTNVAGNSQTNQSEFRIHGANTSFASYPAVSGSDFAAGLRIDGTLTQSSDRRKKKDITSITNAIDTVKQIDGKKFKILNTALEEQDHISKNGYKFGFVAQDVEDLIPEAVKYYSAEDNELENGYCNAYSIDYGSVVALLSNAIKEQQVIIEDLKTRIETLENN